MPPFIPGAELSHAYYVEAVRPLLEQHWPRLPHSAALIGYGSDVLGYDDVRSTDHHWGPRLLLFLSEQDHARLAEAIRSMLGDELPFSFRGYSTHLAPASVEDAAAPHERAIVHLTPGESRPINHLVEVLEPRAWVRGWLGVDPFAGFTTREWLTSPSQKLLEVTAGAVHHDGLGVLNDVRARLAWYPHDVWLYLIACGWQRIGQEEAFVGRCAEAGDDLGSRIVTARLARDLMRLCFLYERRYAPYSKWLGTAFVRLACAVDVQPALAAALAASNYRERERALCRAYEAVAGLHNASRLTEPVEPSVREYFSRGFQVIGAPRFVAATIAALPAGELLDLVETAGLVGSVDQFADSTDVLSQGELPHRLGAIFDVAR